MCVCVCLQFELALRLLTDALDSLSSKPLSDSDRMAASAPLPPPMIPNNYPSISDRCFIGERTNTRSHASMTGVASAWILGQLRGF